jgi:hypothetical protein
MQSRQALRVSDCHNRARMGDSSSQSRVISSPELASSWVSRRHMMAMCGLPDFVMPAYTLSLLGQTPAYPPGSPRTCDVSSPSLA